MLEERCLLQMYLLLEQVSTENKPTTDAEADIANDNLLEHSDKEILTHPGEVM